MKPFNNIAVSPTEPENKANVWIQHSKNLFDKSKAKFINGYFNEESTSIATSSVSKCLYLEIEGNKEYCITKKASARFNVGTTSEVPNVGVNLIDNAKNVTTANTQKNASQIILKASVSAKYMIIWYYASNDDTLSENEILDSIIIKENIQDDILVNDNGVYNSVLNYAENWKDLFNGFKYRKVNNAVEVLFNSKEQYSLTSNQWLTLGTLPVGYRPKVNLYVSILILENNIFIPAMLAIDATGAVSIKQANGKTVNTNEIRGFSSYSIL